MKQSFFVSLLLFLAATHGQRVSLDGKCGIVGGGATCIQSHFGDCCGSAGDW